MIEVGTRQSERDKNIFGVAQRRAYDEEKLPWFSDLSPCAP